MIPPVVLAPLAGGPSTPELAAAVADAGGLGFVAAGYLTPDAFEERLAQARAATGGALGVNLFVLEDVPVDEAAIAAYADVLAAEGHELGRPHFDDDWLDEKLALTIAAGVDVVSTTFSPPPTGLVSACHVAGIQVWASVASVTDARTAALAGADALVVQGAEAGGHRASFDDADESDLPLLELLPAVRAAVDLPLVATGGIGDREAADEVRAAGAVAVQAGTAFLLCPEAGTSEPHRRAIERGGRTTMTRAFTGRRARGLENAFMRAHPNAPSAYPHVHHLTAPMRAAARAAGDAERINLWAGAALASARPRPARSVVAALAP